MGARFGFVYARLGPRLLGLGFLLGDLALRVGLFSLGHAFPLKLLIPRERAGGLFDLPLHAFDGSRKCGFGAAVFAVTHGSHSVR